MLFIGVTATVFTLGALFCPDALRPDKAVLELPSYAERMKDSELSVRAAAEKGIIRCPQDPLEIAVSILNSAELNRRVVPRGLRAQVTATAGRVSGQIEIMGHGASPRENTELANHAAREYLRICRESGRMSVVQTRRYIARCLERCKARSARRAAEIERLKANITEYRSAARHLIDYPMDSETPRVVAWAGYRTLFGGGWMVIAWSLLCAGVGVLSVHGRERHLRSQD